MNDRIRVLAIAPYEGMKQLMTAMANDYPQIDLTVFVGDREQGLQIAKDNFHGNYDAVVSRGGTAFMLRQDLRVPVVEIELSIYDILCALKLTDGMDGKIAMISTSNIAESAQMLCKLMHYDMDIFTYTSSDTMEATLQRIRTGNYRAILCDMGADTAAKWLGLTRFLLTSSQESIRKAFEQVLLLCSSQQNLRDENQFFRELIQGQIGQTMVFDQAGNPFLSTLDNPPARAAGDAAPGTAGIPDRNRAADHPESGRDAVCHTGRRITHRQSHLYRLLLRLPENAPVSQPGGHPLFHPARS